MKTQFVICFLILSISVGYSQQVGISETLITPDPSALLELRSTERGFLITRLTTPQRNAIQNPAEALLIFNVTTKCLEIFVEGWHSVWCEGDTAFICGNAVYDIEGNVYNTVQIGNQCWFTENLKTTKYKNNSQITQIPDNLTWSTTATEGYCWFDNNINNKPNGALYNWYVIQDLRGICPEGWHVPTHNDWLTMTSFLSSSSIYWCGTTNQIAKSLANYSDWPYSASICVIGNPEAYYSNASGFTAKPVGTRNKNGQYEAKANSTQWWSSTISVSCGGTAAEIRHLWETSKILHANSYDCHNKNYGFSVRCVKNL